MCITKLVESAVSKMAFIIPDKPLERLICDSCNKYLSVRPVKIYRNGDTKCGRCAATETPDNGVLSLIAHIGDYCLFKCINRFDGCRELLSYSQVLNHEKTCESRIYQCPVCQDGGEFTSLLLQRHFRNEHETNILAYPRFILNLTALLEPSKMFFYSQEDYLFFISFRCNHSGGEIRISICLIGTLEQAQKITRQFWVTSPDNQTVHLVSKKMHCTNTEIESYWFCIEELDVVNTKSILVQFELRFNDPRCLRISSAIGANEDLEELIVSGPKMTRYVPLTITTLAALAEHPKDFIKEPYVPFTPMVVASKPNKIHLTPDFLQTYPDVRTSPCCTSIIHLNRFVFLVCKNCNDICWTGIDEGMDQFFICEKDQHSLCYCCFKYLRSQLKIEEADYISTTLSWNMLKKIQFVCKWGCGESFEVTDILIHEGGGCELREFWSCIEVTCNYQGKLSDMSDHACVSDSGYLYSGRFCDSYIAVSFKKYTNQHWLKSNELLLLEIKNEYGNNEISFVQSNINKIALIFDSERRYLAQFRQSINFKCEGNYCFLKIIILE